jgi:hypothetical protein
MITKKFTHSLIALVGFLCLGFNSEAPAAIVTVPGYSNPWLAGMPDGSTAKTDSAPAQSPVEITGLSLGAGQILFFSATGATNHSGCEGSSPDAVNCGNAYTGVANGISGVTAPLNALLGVFLSSAQPDTVAPPTDLDFTGNTNFAMLTPKLQQVFFIGDGLTGTGSGLVQQFVVPENASRLYLGSMDGYEWSNNLGAFTVTISTVPIPSSILLFGSALAGLSFRKWCRNSKTMP